MCSVIYKLCMYVISYVCDSVYAVAGCITVGLHKSDKRNALLGPLLINT